MAAVERDRRERPGRERERPLHRHVRSKGHFYRYEDKALCHLKLHANMVQAVRGSAIAVRGSKQIVDCAMVRVVPTPAFDGPTASAGQDACAIPSSAMTRWRFYRWDQALS